MTTPTQELFIVHVLENGKWSYPICYKKNHQYYGVSTNTMYDRTLIYNVEKS